MRPGLFKLPLLRSQWLNSAIAVTILGLFQTFSVLAEALPDLPPETNEKAVLASDVDVTLKKSLQGLPQAHIKFVQIFESMGGAGRTLDIHFSDRVQTLFPMTVAEMTGPWFVVDRLPKKINAKAPLLALRDPVLLKELRQMQAENVGIIFRVSYIRDENDAAVWGRPDDEFSKAFMPVAFPESSKLAVLEISPTMSRDILVHEKEHIEQMKPSHPLWQFDARSKTVVEPKLLKTLRKTAGEIMSYRAQVAYLQAQPGQDLYQKKRMGIITMVRYYLQDAMRKIKVTDENQQALCEFQKLLRETLSALPGNGDLQEELSYYMGECPR